MSNILVDYIGDWWEVLQTSRYNSTYVPKQDELWVRPQTQEMREEADSRIKDGEDSQEVWNDIYLSGNHARVWVREVPHFESSGAAAVRGPRGVYEVMGWDGAGAADGNQAGAMARLFVSPYGRWFEESRETKLIDRASFLSDKEKHEAARTTLDVDTSGKSLIELSQIYADVAELTGAINSLDSEITQIDIVLSGIDSEITRGNSNKELDDKAPKGKSGR